MDKTIIIAEAGVNHNGSLDLAKKLVDIASDSGADYIKFQTFVTELNISKSAKKANYQIKNTNNLHESQFEMVKKLELSFESFIELKSYCDQLNIGFLSTGFDFDSVDFLDELGVDYYKIPSGDLTNKPLLKHISSKKKSIILSTGMADMNEVKMALDILISNGVKKDQITILHCNTEYPTPFEDVNLKAMITMRDVLGVNIGYSDHTLGLEVPLAAVALGAKMIEKHFTLDKTLEGPDHKCSLDPTELNLLVSSIRNVEKVLEGSGKKKPSQSEKKNISVARKSLHTKVALNKGDVIKQDHLICLRPGDGISPMEIDSIVGLKVSRKLDPNTKLRREDLI